MTGWSVNELILAACIDHRNNAQHLLMYTETNKMLLIKTVTQTCWEFIIIQQSYF